MSLYGAPKIVVYKGEKMQETDREMLENNCILRLCCSGGAELDNACLCGDHFVKLNDVALFM